MRGRVIAVVVMLLGGLAGILSAQRPSDPGERRRALFPTATDAEWGDWRWQMRHAVHDAAAWEFLERLASRLRVVENRSISDLDEERGDLDGLARRLGYPAGARESSARRAMQADYTRHTDAIRRAYLEVLGVQR